MFKALLCQMSKYIFRINQNCVDARGGGAVLIVLFQLFVVATKHTFYCTDTRK